MDKHTPDRTKGILALVFLAVCYAGTGVVTRYLDHYFSLFQQIYIRIFLALIFGMFLFRNNFDFGKLRKISAPEWLLLILRSAASFVFGAVLWVEAANTTKLANVGFIDSLPITAALSFLILREKATFGKIFYLALSFIGVIMLSVSNLSDITSFGYGELLVFIAGFFFAFRNISRKWHSSLLNDQEITQIMFFLGIIFLFIISLIFRETLVIPQLNAGLVIMLMLGGLMMIANIYFTNYGFAHVPAVLGNNILNLEAVFTILFGFLFYREVSTIKELIGGALIIFSVIKMNQIK